MATLAGLKHSYAVKQRAVGIPANLTSNQVVDLMRGVERDREGERERPEGRGPYCQILHGNVIRSSHIIMSIRA